MAEILISLTIIGVIAAITLPSLRANINEKAWATQKKALYSRMSQAISMLPSLNGYGVNPDDESKTANNAAMAFINNGLGTVLKINNICDSNNLKKCGIPDKIKVSETRYNIDTNNFKNLSNYINTSYSSSLTNGESFSYSIINTKAAAFETANGESILTIYNPYCLSNEMLPAVNKSYYPSAPYFCVNFIYDLNGRKGPNQAGKDIGFMTALYSVNSEVVAPNFFKKNLDLTTSSYTEAHAACRDAGGRLPSVEEGTVMYINKYFFFTQNDYMGKTYNLELPIFMKNIGTNRYAIHTTYGYISNNDHGNSYRTRCVEK